MIRKLCIFITLFLLSLSTSLLAFEEKKVLEVPVEQVKEVQFIKISDVPSSASKVIVDIDDISKTLEAQKEILEIEASLPSYMESIDILLQSPINEHLEYITIPELVKKENEWNIYLNQFEKWNKILNVRIDTFEQKKKSLDGYAETWQDTRKNANKLLAPEAILDQISKVIVQVDVLQKDVKKRYDQLLTDLNGINTKILSLKELLKKNKEAKNIVSSRLFYQNGLPLTTLFVEKSFTPLDYLSTVYMTFTEKMNTFLIYYQDNLDRLYLFALFSFLVFVFVFVFYYLYKKHKLFIFEESYSKKKYFFIVRPFSSFLILMLLINVFMFDDIPPTAKQFQLLILLIPIFRIFQTLVNKDVLKYLYIYTMLFFLSIIEKNGTGSELDARIFSLILTTGLIVYILYFIKKRILDKMTKSFISKFIYKVFIVCIGLLVFSLGADIYGATLLSSRITHSIFIAMYSSILFYVLTIILTGYLIILLRRRIATAPLLLENFTKNVEKTTIFLIKVFMVFWWFLIVTRSVGLYDVLIEFKNEVIALSWTIGNSTISVTSIFDFFMIIVGTWFFVKFVNVILEVEIFSRFTFSRGIPTAITTVLNYMIVISGTFIALSSLGITSEQFTLVLGALGVGIGFGLRNIIANFVSGIIMVFERPIQIGDTIEINTTMGTVQGIGTRSSTLKTFDGSEVIIPNADFISKEITNWTLSDERRRKTLVFRVAAGSDIYKVLEVMNTVVMAHPNVLKEPEPISTLLGFGDYYLEFKLYYWLHENLIVAQSDIAIAVHEMLQKEGIDMPIPKQEFLKNEGN